jgi:hypothetical protein
MSRMSDVPAQLDYAPPLAWHRRTRARLVIVGVMLLVGIIATIKFGPVALGRLQLVRVQRACLTYTAPPTQVVYESDRVAAKALLAGRGGYFTTSGRDAGAAPVAWRALQGRQRRYSGSATLFLHERATPAGEKYLVAIDLYRHPSVPAVAVGVQTYSRGSLTRDPLYVPITSVGDGCWLRLEPNDAIRFYAGQCDAATRRASRSTTT